MHSVARAARLASAALVTLAVLGCQASSFHYHRHEPPRVSVIHQPIHPEANEAIRLTARPEVAAARSVARVEVTVLGPASVSGTYTCSAADLTDGDCAIDLPALGVAGDVVYSARVVDDRGEEGTSPSAYSFQVGDPDPGRPLRLRAPFTLLEGDRVFDVLLVRDRESFDDAVALAHVEKAVYTGLLEDPAYRWRDDQIALHYSRFEGTTRDYYSGLAARCGQTPWRGSAAEGAAETAAAFADVVGVVHAKDGHRDCSGLDIDGGQARFSADVRQPELLQHELGHALFGLGDEYSETTESRRSGPPAVPPLGLCACCDARDPTGTGTGTGRCLPGAPPCGEFDRPLECYPANEVCPPLDSSCVHPNTFPDLGSCQRAAAAAAAHPGVEAPLDDTECRLLCSGDCPCPGPGTMEEIWILDVRFPEDAAGTDDDVMGNLDARSPRERHGPACARCMETTFCLKWEEGRGRSRAEAEAHCLDP